MSSARRDHDFQSSPIVICMPMISGSVAVMLACARIGVVSVPASAGDFLFLHVRRYPSQAAASGLRGFKARIRKVTISRTVRLRSQALL